MYIPCDIQALNDALLPRYCLLLIPLMELQKIRKHFFSNLKTENQLNFSNYFIELKILKYLAKVIIMNLTTKSGYEPLSSMKTPLNYYYFFF